MNLAYNKAKAAGFEVDIVDYLRKRFPDHATQINRLRLQGSADQGDILASLPVSQKLHNKSVAVRHVIIEAKHVKKIELAAFIAEVTVEVENWTKAVKSSASGIVVIKRRNRPIGQSYVVQTLDSFLGLIA